MHINVRARIGEIMISKPVFSQREAAGMAMRKICAILLLTVALLAGVASPPSPTTKSACLKSSSANYRASP